MSHPPAGKLTPSIDRTYSLEQVPRAMRHLEDGEARGRSPSRLSSGCGPLVRAADRARRRRT
ncbi:MAG TPA: zinc-binding dehydrogenase [Actinoplanes sp.]|nr:zinc-binding dehydrogenase [Actinoplanes sp.]